MRKTQQLRLRKELERFEPFAASTPRQDFVAGRWFPRFLEQLLGSYAVTTTPEELRAAHEGLEDEALAQAVVSKAVFDALDITAAHADTTTATDVRQLTERSTGGAPQRLGHGAVLLVAELLYVVKRGVDLIFEIAAVHRRRMDAGQTERILDIFGRSLGHFPWDEIRRAYEAGPAEDDGGYPGAPSRPVARPPAEQLGARIFDRAVVQPLQSEHPLTMRKGFYCYLMRSIGQNAPALLADLPEWVAPSEEESGPVTGEMQLADPDELGVLGDMMV